MELEKLICYCLDRDIVTAEDVEAVWHHPHHQPHLRYGQCHCGKAAAESLAALLRSAGTEGPALQVLFLIAAVIPAAQTKELKNRGHDNKTIASKIGVPPFAAGKYVAQASHFKTSVLKNAVKQCVETEEAVKSGRMNDMMSVEILILSGIALVSLRNALNEFCSRYRKVHGQFSCSWTFYLHLLLLPCYIFRFKVMVFFNDTCDALNFFGYYIFVSVNTQVIPTSA